MDWIEKALEVAPTKDRVGFVPSGRLGSWQAWADLAVVVLHEGIEEVRALRKENEKLQEKLYAENGHAKQFHASLVERTRECDGLRKENEELKARVKAEASRVDQYKDLIRRLDDKIERLKKEKADLERVHGKLQDVFSKEVEVIERLSERLNKADSEIARLKRGDALLAKEKARNSCNMNDSLRYQLGDEVLKLFCKHGGYLKDD